MGDEIAAALGRAGRSRSRSDRPPRIEFTRGQPNRVQHYRELIRRTQATLAYADQAVMQLWQVPDPIAAALWQAESGSRGSARGARVR
jgi:IS5 family transposase